MSECGASETRNICRHCGTDLKSIKQERALQKLANSGSIQVLPVYNKCEDYDFENFIVYSTVLGWNNLEFDFEYTVTNRRYLGHDRYDVAGFGITSDCYGQIDVATLISKGVKFKSALGESSCVIVTATAKAEVLGIKVDGYYDDDGWNGSIGKIIRFGNQVLKKQFDEYYQNGVSIDEIKIKPLSSVKDFAYVEDGHEDDGAEPLYIKLERERAGSRKADEAKKIQNEIHFKKLQKESNIAVACSIYCLIIGIFGLIIINSHTAVSVIGLLFCAIVLKILWGSDHTVEIPVAIGVFIVGTVILIVYCLLIFLMPSPIPLSS